MYTAEGAAKAGSAAGAAYVLILEGILVKEKKGKKTKKVYYAKVQLVDTESAVVVFSNQYSLKGRGYSPGAIFAMGQLPLNLMAFPARIAVITFASNFMSATVVQSCCRSIHLWTTEASSILTAWKWAVSTMRNQRRTASLVPAQEQPILEMKIRSRHFSSATANRLTWQRVTT